MISVLIKMLPESEEEEENDERKKRVNKSGKLALRAKEFDSDD